MENLIIDRIFLKSFATPMCQATFEKIITGDDTTFVVIAHFPVKSSGSSSNFKISPFDSSTTAYKYFNDLVSQYL